MSRPSRKDDSAFIQRLLRGEIKRCGKGSDQVAAEMQDLLGTPITQRMLGSFTAQSKELHRWPAQFDIAFCEVVGSYKLLTERVKRAGFLMVGPKEARLIRIGKAYEQKIRAEQTLQGIDL
jgi:hypothetical protein